MDIDSLKEDEPEPNGDKMASLKGEVEEEEDVELEDAGANADPDEDDKDRVWSKKTTKEAKDDLEDGNDDDDESSAEEAEITRCPCGITGASSSSHFLSRIHLLRPARVATAFTAVLTRFCHAGQLPTPYRG